MHCILDSTSCMTLYCLLYPHLHMCCFSICLFVFVPQHHVLPALFVYFPFQIVSVVDRQWANIKSDCTCCIRRGLGRRLRSSLLLNSSPSTSRDVSLSQLAEICQSLATSLHSDI